MVYSSSNIELKNGDKVWVLAGEGMTLNSCKTTKSTTTLLNGEKVSGMHYNFCNVSTTDGKKGSIQLRYLSKKPLLYNLRKPGKAKELLLKVFQDAYPLAEEMHKLQMKHNYQLSSYTGKITIDGQDFIGNDYHMVDAMKESFTFSKMLVHNLVYGSHISKDSIMRDKKKKWLVDAEDETILDWFSKGIADKAMQKKYINAKNCLDKLGSVSSAGSEIAGIERKIEEKPWRRGIKDVSEKKLVALDKEKIDKLEKRKGELTKRIAKSLAEAKKLKAKVK